MPRGASNGRHKISVTGLEKMDHLVHFELLYSAKVCIVTCWSSDIEMKPLGDTMSGLCMTHSTNAQYSDIVLMHNTQT